MYQKLLSKQLWMSITAIFVMLLVFGISSVALSSSDSEHPRQPGATATAQVKLTQIASELMRAALKQTATAVALTEAAQPAATPTATPSATSTLTPITPTPRPVSPMAEVLVEGLNVRAGAGANFPVVAKGEIGQRFPVSGQTGNCAWLQIVLEDGSAGWISGAAAYSSLNVACSTLPGARITLAPTSAPVAPLPTATLRPVQQQPTAAAPQPAAVQPNASTSAGNNAAGDVITSFEPLGSWRRGDEPYGTLTQSTVEAYSGVASAAFTYDFPAAAGSGNYVVFMAQPDLRIPADAQALTMQVFGDGSGHFLNAWIRDAGNQVWQLTFGRINHTGWAPMTAALVASREWPNGPISDSASDELTPPFALRALVLNGAPDGVASKGVIYLDALTASDSVAEAATGSSSADNGSTTGGAATAGSAPAPSGPLTGKIAFTRFNGRAMDTLIYDLASDSVIRQFPNWRQPDLGSGYLLVNGEGGGVETIIRTSDNGDNQHLATTNAEDAFPQFSPSLESLVYASTKAGDGKSRIYWQVDASFQDNASPMTTNLKELVGDYPVYLDNWRIAYQGCNSWGDGSKCGIYTADTRGSIPVRATESTSDIPSGSLKAQVLFSSNRAGNWDVWAVNFDGSGLQQLTTDPAIDGLADASPDGRNIAFVSNRGGAWAVWAMNADGSNQRKLFDIGGGYGGGDYDWIRERISWDQ